MLEYIFPIAFFGGLFYGSIALLTKMNYAKVNRTNYKKYSKDENIYRAKILDYIRANIDALIWSVSTNKPKDPDEQIKIAMIQNETITIPSGSDDIEIRFNIADDQCTALFSVFDQCILAVSQDQAIYLLSDSYQNYKNNEKKRSRGNNQLPKTDYYTFLQHDIPTIALVYIEHYIRNCTIEKEKYYMDYKNVKSEETPKIIYKTDPFYAWENEATRHFIDQYKDEYYGNKEEEETLYQVDYSDENQTQNG